jgi:hypothetical protein
MKKNLLVFCLLLVSLTTLAQIPSIGIKGGLNFATMVNSSNGLNFAESSIKTFNAGVFADIKFGNFSLQPALNYTGKGGNYTATYTNPPVLYLNINSGAGTSAPTQVKEQLYYLQLPVNFVYHIPVIIGDIYFGAGPYVAEGLSGKTTYSSGGVTTTQNVSFGNSAADVKATQFGADAIIGFKFKGGLLINANYDLGLTNDVPSGAGGSSKSRVIGISVGYVFL